MPNEDNAEKKDQKPAPVDPLARPRIVELIDDAPAPPPVNPQLNAQTRHLRESGESTEPGGKKDV